MHKLHPGEPFPFIAGDSIPHGRISLPERIRAGHYGVILVYRAHWCPYSRKQLADFQAHLGQLEEAGADLFALSTDPFERAKQTVELLNLTYSVMYGLDGAKTAQALGAYHEHLRDILQPAHFVLDLERNLSHVSVSSGPMGFVSAEDSVRYVRDVRMHGPHIANVGHAPPH
jgi:peroxiredoxin